MSELNLEEVPQRIRDMFNKGFIALERGNTDYAIDLLMTCVEAEPKFLQARKFLRAAEMQQAKSKKSSSFSRLTSGISGMPAYLSAMATLKSGKFDQALMQAEKLLRNDPLNMRYVEFFVECAKACDLPEAALQTLEVAREQYPEDSSILLSLGNLYQDLGQTKLAREAFERLSELNPHDPVALKSLKDALARDTVASSGWGKVADGKGFREGLKDQDQTKKIEQMERGVKTDHDADVLIEDTLNKIKAEPKNVNYYRSLARLYAQRKMFNEAVATIQKAMELAPGDPELDKTVTGIMLQKIDSEIDTLKASGDTAGAEAKQGERDQYFFDNLQDRVKRYPNDYGLRYELGVILFENDYINEAIQQLQLAQKSPKHRIQALFSLARCFKSKEHFDMAFEQLEKASGELVVMDEQKKDVLYELGDVCEKMGDPEKAAFYFKQIYSVDIGYKDIADKIENVYKK